MGKLTLKEWLKEKIGTCAWHIFLWCLDITDEQYWENIYQDQKKEREQAQASKNTATLILLLVITAVTMQGCAINSCFFKGGIIGLVGGPLAVSASCDKYDDDSNRVAMGFLGLVGNSFAIPVVTAANQDRWEEKGVNHTAVVGGWYGFSFLYGVCRWCYVEHFEHRECEE